MKRCIECREDKEASEYDPAPGSIDGMSCSCKECAAAWSSGESERERATERLAATISKRRVRSRRAPQNDLAAIRDELTQVVLGEVRRGLRSHRKCSRCSKSKSFPYHPDPTGGSVRVVWLCFDHHPLAQMCARCCEGLIESDFPRAPLKTSGRTSKCFDCVRHERNFNKAQAQIRRRAAEAEAAPT